MTSDDPNHLRSVKALIEERYKDEILEACRAAGLRPYGPGEQVCAARSAKIEEIQKQFLLQAIADMPYRRVQTFKNNLTAVFRDLGFHRRVT